MSSRDDGHDDADGQAASQAKRDVVERTAHQRTNSKSTGQTKDGDAARGRPGPTGNEQEEADDENRPRPQNLSDMAYVIGHCQETQDTDDHEERTDHSRPGQRSSHRRPAKPLRRRTGGASAASRERTSLELQRTMKTSYLMYAPSPRLSSTIFPTACTLFSQPYFSEDVWNVGAVTK